MKFKIKKEILLEKLIITSKAISVKNLIPILSGIKIDLKKEGLYLTASDNDIIIQTFIKNEDIESIEELGSIVIPGKYIVEIVRKIPSSLIEINETDGFKLLISYKTGEFSINGMNSDEFPKLELKETNNPIFLNSEKFKEIINETVFAISTSETRPILTGLNFKINKNILECYATDSYRLAQKKIEIKSNINNINIVIPGKNLVEFKNIMIDNEKDVELHIYENKILLKHDNILFQSKLLNGNYPDVSKLIPNEFNVNVKIDPAELFNVIDRASLLSNDRDKVIIKLELKNNKINISSNTPELGKVEEYIIVKGNGEIVISFISKYMLEALKSYNIKEISLYFNSEEKPFILKNGEDNSLIQLILPIKTY